MHTRLEPLDLARLRALIESGFGRRLTPDYFERTELHRAYVSENYRAALILTQRRRLRVPRQVRGADDAQGEGLGRAVWQVMREENPQLFWRSRHDNPVNPFYYAESDGCYKEAKWKVFWYGMRDFAEIERCVEHCRARPPTCRNEPVRTPARRTTRRGPA